MNEEGAIRNNINENHLVIWMLSTDWKQDARLYLVAQGIFFIKLRHP